MSELPGFLWLAGHPVRWALLRALSRSDRDVHELTSLVGAPQNLVSYHLARLRAEGMVVARRSDRDARHAFYRADITACARLLTASAAALHPALALSPNPKPSKPTVTRPRVLFLCTGNSARSQMAEAFANAGSTLVAVSAGDEMRPVHPNAVRALAARGLDISRQKSKSIETFAGERFDAVVTLCDRVRERCPEFAGADLVHWSIPDPVDEALPDEETYPKFVEAAGEIDARVGYLSDLLSIAT